MIEERTGVITFQGNPLTLIGKGVSVGEAAPEFCVLANDLTPRTLADYKGKVLVISVVPSLDTPVCDMQTRRFNTEAAKLSDNVRILTISCDLPFAQTRWCGAAGVDAVETLSDHRDLSFGTASPSRNSASSAAPCSSSAPTASSPTNRSSRKSPTTSTSKPLSGP